MNLNEQLGNIWERVISWIPDILGVLVILFIGYLIAKALQAAVATGLKAINLNRKIFDLKEGNLVRKISDNPTALIGNIVYWLVWIRAITVAIPLLNIPVLSQIIFGFYAYLPNILAAILILVVAVLLAAGSSVLAMKLAGDTPTGKVIATVLPSIIMTISIFMILVQLKIAVSIVIITYAALIGALALGFALAFGLGGREVAGQILEEAYRKGRLNMGQMKRDLETAKERGRKEAQKYEKKYR